MSGNEWSQNGEIQTGFLLIQKHERNRSTELSKGFELIKSLSRQYEKIVKYNSKMS